MSLAVQRHNSIQVINNFEVLGLLDSEVVNQMK